MKYSAPAESNPFRVMVIDDDFEMAQWLLTILAPLGFECYYALDAVSGLEEIEREDPHLLLLDLNLGEEPEEDEDAAESGAAMGAAISATLSGLELLARLRRTHTIPIIALHEPNGPEAALHAFKAGADDCVDKPGDARLISARVVAQLRRAYRYKRRQLTREELESAEEEKPEPGTPKIVPPGWAVCERCGYMGPDNKFEHESALGQRSLRCPNCKETEYVTFSIFDETADETDDILS